VNALLSERKSREVLAIAHNQLRQYALRIENQATLQERNRIAREIHDSLGHTLTAQSIQLENALLSCSSNAEEMKTYLVQAKQLGSEALQEVRQSVAALRSNPLQGKNLKEAIATMLENFRSMTNAQLNYEVQLSQPISVEVGTAIYRILQEALTNIYKHSMASSVTIQIFTRANQLSLVIEDNGVGFDPAQNTTGFGLQAMRERTVALGGNFYLTSEPERGCLVRAIVPIQASLPEVTDMSYEL
jgi:signal transduction histidine kinase